jgi:hypothetical protein
MKKVKTTTKTETAPVKEPKQESVLALAAKNVNAVLKPEPPLDIAAEDGAIQAELIEMFPQIKNDDELDLTTWKVLKDLGWSKAPKAEKKDSTLEKGKKPAEKKNESRISRREAVFAVLHNLGARDTGVDAKELEMKSTELMIKKNGKAGSHADVICKDVLAALVEFGAMKSSEDGTCKFI